MAGPPASVPFGALVAFGEPFLGTEMLTYTLPIPCIPMTATCDWSLHFQRVIPDFGPATCDAYIWLPGIVGGSPDTDGVYLGTLTGNADIVLAGPAPILPSSDVTVSIWLTTLSAWRLFVAGQPASDSYYSTDQTCPTMAISAGNTAAAFRSAPSGFSDVGVVGFTVA